MFLCRRCVIETVTYLYYFIHNKTATDELGISNICFNGVRQLATFCKTCFIILSYVVTTTLKY